MPLMRRMAESESATAPLPTTFPSNPAPSTMATNCFCRRANSNCEAYRHDASAKPHARNIICATTTCAAVGILLSGLCRPLPVRYCQPCQLQPTGV